MNLDWSRRVPPGLSASWERRLFGWALSAASLCSLLTFCARYWHARQGLYMQTPTGNVLLPHALIADLPILLHRVLIPVWLLMLLMPILVALHYLHYRRGSMSIYLMRRLPNRKLLHQQCWTLPLLGLLLCICAVLLLLALFTLIYLYATPAQCLPPIYRRF